MFSWAGEGVEECHQPSPHAVVRQVEAPTPPPWTRPAPSTNTPSPNSKPRSSRPPRRESAPSAGQPLQPRPFARDLTQHSILAPRHVRNQRHAQGRGDPAESGEGYRTDCVAKNPPIEAPPSETLSLLARRSLSRFTDPFVPIVRGSLRVSVLVGASNPQFLASFLDPASTATGGIQISLRMRLPSFPSG